MHWWGRQTPGEKDTPIVGPVNPSLVRKWGIRVSDGLMEMVCIGYDASYE